MFWWNRNAPEVIFGDLRRESHQLCDGRMLNIDPDIIMDFTDMPFKNNRFKLIVFDPPHMKTLGDNSWMAKKYGRLPKNWQPLIRDGLKECFRVLRKDGILIFKWSDVDIKVSDVLKLIEQRPLFGHRTMVNNKTIWLCFMKSNTPP